MSNAERSNRGVLSKKRQNPQLSNLNEFGSLTRKLLVLFVLFSLSNTALALQLTKTSVPAVSVNFGESVTYTYKITNNNTVALNNLTLFDDRLGLIPVGSQNLAIGEVRTVTAIHVINATDMPGPLKNNAQAFAKDPNYNPVSSSKVSKMLSLGFSGSLKVDKYPDVAEQTVGFPISYDIKVTNVNGFTVKNITAQDVIYHPTAYNVVVTLDRTTLLPGQVANGTVVVYNIVQEDIRGPPVGKIGAGLPVVTDYASAKGYPSWENPPFGENIEHAQ